MHATWTDRRILASSAVALLIAACPALGQKGGSTGGSAGSGIGSTGSVGSTNRTLSTLPNSTLNPSNTITSRPIFLSGKVMFDDGTQPSPDIRIERVCGGSPHLETHTDSKGHFSFQVGQNPMVDTDAADETSGGLGRPNSPLGMSSGSFGSTSANRVDPLWNCELRASYPGYRSDIVNLANRRSLDDPEIGTLVLHRLSNVHGSTISLTTALAPRHAQKEYEKGVQLAQKEKFDEAEKHLRAATDTYPKYAIAWFELGQIERHEGKTDDARKSYESAIAADPKYVSPYDQLAWLSSQQQKWEDAASFSKQVIQLNPVEFPGDFWFNAIANYKLGKLTEAEKSANELLKLDAAHKFPEAETMLAQILLEKRNYSDAATHLRAYLALVPNAKNADQLKQTLARLDEAKAQ
ncbi:MAG: DUF3808 domain-containing protein, partial [Acidobacteriaceae bacterium]|nr:DUF3808 domain-containing protein [Acidobacteriaceae bacterium]